MSYVPSRVALRAPRARHPVRPTLSGFLDDFGFGSMINVDQACLDQANAAVAPLDSQIYNFAKNWQPTGTYHPEEVQAIVLQTMAVVRSASDAVSAAPLSTADARQMTQEALDKLYQAGTDSLRYSQAVSDALANGNDAIEAPDLKQWVLDSLNACSFALVHASVLSCNMPLLATWIIAITPPLQAAIATCLKAIGIAANTAINVLKVPGKILGFVEDVLTYGAIGLGAYLLYRWTKKRKA
jgi:hypothetical protein